MGGGGRSRGVREGKLERVQGRGRWEGLVEESAGAGLKGGGRRGVQGRPRYVCGGGEGEAGRTHRRRSIAYRGGGGMGV